MYDTVRLWLASDETERISGLLTDVETRVKPTGEYNQYGSLANMRVSVGNSSLTFEGSLSKYVNGNNLERFTRKQTQRAIEKMSDSLALSIHRAKVWRIDLAENFILNRPVREYLSLLGGIRHFKRFPYDHEGLRYKNGVRQMVFYNKVKEYRDKKQSVQIPEVFQGRNVLRYELRFTGRLKQQFGSEIKALDLYNENFYIGIVNRWKNAYSEIRKRSRFKMDSFDFENVKGLLNQLALIGLETDWRRAGCY